MKKRRPERAKKFGRAVVMIPASSDEFTTQHLRLFFRLLRVPHWKVVAYNKHIAREQIKGKTEKRRFEV